MKWRNIAILASLTVFAAAVSAAPKKAPAKPAKVDPKAAAAAAAKAEADAKAKAAADAAAKAKADEPTPVEGFFVKKVKAGSDGKEITMRIGGYVDAYYAYHTAAGNDTRTSAPYNGFAGADLGAGTTATGRIFESAGQQFSLGLIQTKFEMGNEDWQVVADLIHGPNAEQTNFNNFRGNGVNTSSTTSTVIKQAYVAGNLLKNLKVTAGQFSTHVGYEVVESYQNPNYMLGYLFGFGPFYHTGLKLDYSLFDGKLGFMAGITNGWDLQYDNNKDKSAIGQISIKPTSALSIFINYVGGNETSAYNAATSNVGGMRHIGDLVIQYQVNKMVKVGVNVVYGENKVNTETAAQRWGGAAGYLSVTPVDGFTLSYRLDYFDDTMGARGLLQNAAAGITSNKVMGHTLTGTIAMYGGHFLIRPEVKYDKAAGAVFGSAGELKTDNITALLSFTGVY